MPNLNNMVPRPNACPPPQRCRATRDHRHPRRHRPQGPTSTGASGAVLEELFKALLHKLMTGELRAGRAGPGGTREGGRPT